MFIKGVKTIGGSEVEAAAVAIVVGAAFVDWAFLFSTTNPAGAMAPEVSE